MTVTGGEGDNSKEGRESSKNMCKGHMNKNNGRRKIECRRWGLVGLGRIMRRIMGGEMRTTIIEQLKKKRKKANEKKKKKLHA